MSDELTKEAKALGAFLGAMKDCKLDGPKMRTAMLEALGIAEDHAIPVSVLSAIRAAGMTLVKTRDGYQLLKLGKIEAQSLDTPRNCGCQYATDCDGFCRHGAPAS